MCVVLNTEEIREEIKALTRENPSKAKRFQLKNYGLGEHGEWSNIPRSDEFECIVGLGKEEQTKGTNQGTN